MRSSNSAMIAARAAGNLVSRDFIAVAGRDRTSGTIEWAYFWNDIGVVSAPIVNLDTGATEYHNWTGSGPIIDVGDIAFICEQSITVSNQEITLNHLDADVINQVRGYDLHEQALNIYQGDFDPITRALVSPAESVFSGFIDTVQIAEPSVEEAGSITITVRSHVTELTRTNTLTRSHASEILRNASDTFYKDTAVIGDWVYWWGQDSPKPMKSNASVNVITSTLEQLANGKSGG